jgi:acyl dehydratase
MTGDIGESRRFTLPIDPIQARRFAVAADDRNPAYFDDDAARRAGYDRAIAPPMFVCSIFDHQAGPAEDELRSDGVAPGSFPSVVPASARLMGGGQRVEFLGPVYQGDEVDVVRTLVEHYRRPSGRYGELTFVVVEVRVTGSDGTLLARILDTLVVRV